MQPGSAAAEQAYPSQPPRSSNVAAEHEIRACGPRRWATSALYFCTSVVLPARPCFVAHAIAWPEQT